MCPTPPETQPETETIMVTLTPLTPNPPPLTHPSLTKTTPHPTLPNTHTLHYTRPTTPPQLLHHLSTLHPYHLTLPTGKFFGVGGMGCSGCSGMVTGELEKVCEKVWVDLERKVGVVEGIKDGGLDGVLEGIRKKGKGILEWGAGVGVLTRVFEGGLGKLEVGGIGRVVEGWKGEGKLVVLKDVFGDVEGVMEGLGVGMGEWEIFKGGK